MNNQSYQLFMTRVDQESQRLDKAQRELDEKQRVIDGAQKKIDETRKNNSYYSAREERANNGR